MPDHTGFDNVKKQARNCKSLELFHELICLVESLFAVNRKNALCSSTSIMIITRLLIELFQTRLIKYSESLYRDNFHLLLGKKKWSFV